MYSSHYKLKQSIYNSTSTKILPWFIIGSGIFLRTFHYLQNRSLYTDEAYLANNLLNRNLYELILPLDASQHAPIFFLFSVKILTNLLGTNEFVLRLFPFGCGLAALIAFYFLLKKCNIITVIGLITGLTIFSFAFPLIYYSSEFKQYSVEAFATIICYLMYFRFHRSTSLKDMFVYGLAGVILVWFSYSSIFILAGIGIVCTLFSLRNKLWKNLYYHVPVYCFWASSFFINLIFIIIPNSLDNPSIINTWQSAYLPLTIHSISDVKWYIDTLFLLFDFPLGLNWNFLQNRIHPKLTLSIIGLISMIIGVYTWYRNNPQQLLIIVLPIFLTLFASAMEKYPFTERFLLFLAPNLILLSAVGVSAIEVLLKKNHYKLFWIISICLWLVLPTLIRSGNDLVNHHQFGEWKRREMKDVINYLHYSKQADEYILLYHTASAFNYYNSVYNLNWPSTTILAKNQLDNKKVTDELKNRKASKFWIIVTGNTSEEATDKMNVALNDRDLFIKYFNNNFIKLKEYKAVGVYTALYKLRESPN